MKLDVKALIEQVVKEELGKIQETKPYRVNPKYKYFALDKATNKIINGWEDLENDRENVLHWAKIDLKDMDIKPSDVKVLSIAALKRQNIDPFSWDSWRKDGNGSVSETTIVTTTDGTLSTATPDQKKQAQDASAKGDSVKVTKTGTPIAEKKKEEDQPAEDTPPVEDKPIEDAPAADAGQGLSATLNKHISSAIDAAAKCIQDSDDKKYEKVLGKVIKNLTAAQGALEAVQAHETELAEEAAIADEKSTQKYTQALRKALKGSFKNPEHIEAIVKKYNKVIKASKDKDPNKLAEVISAHALKEGFIQK